MLHGVGHSCYVVSATHHIVHRYGHAVIQSDGRREVLPIYRSKCKTCRNADIRNKRQDKKPFETKESLQATKCGDCTAAPEPGSSYCSRHLALRRNAAATKRARDQPKSKTRRGRAMITTLQEKRHQINEAHDIPPSKDNAKPPARILYQGSDVDTATKFLTQTDDRGNDYPRSAGQNKNRLAASICAGCKIDSNSGVKRYRSGS